MILVEGVLSNVRVFEKELGKRLFSAYFVASDGSLTCKVRGPELEGRKDGETVTMDIAALRLESFEFAGRIGVNIVAKCNSIKPRS